MMIKIHFKQGGSLTFHNVKKVTKVRVRKK